jgi:hypothetical protein
MWINEIRRGHHAGRDIQHVPRDWLMIGDGRQHGDINLIQVKHLVAHIRRYADYSGIDGSRPEHPAARDLGDLERSTLQVGHQVFK